MNDLPPVPAQLKEGRIELDITRFGSSVVKNKEADEKENRVKSAVSVAGFAEKPASAFDKFLECFGYSRWVPLKVKVGGEEKSIFVNVNSLAKKLLVSTDSIRKAAQQNELEVWVKVAKAYTALKTTFPGQLSKEQIRNVCKQIEANGKAWVESLKKEETFKNHNFVGIPATVQVHSDSEIYISLTGAKAIGEGSFKVVKLALKYASAETVAEAVSTMKDYDAKNKAESEQWIKKVDREIAFMDVLKPYPNIVKYYKVAYSAANNEPPKQRLMMKFYNGGELYKRIPTAENMMDQGLDFIHLSNANMKRIMVGALTGISGMHKEDIVHHDIKPENIFLLQTGDTLNADIGDLGLAQQLIPETPISNIGRNNGTLNYLPPEQRAAKLREQIIKAPNDAITIAQTEAFLKTSPEVAQCDVIKALKAKDVFALGITFYEMLTGLKPEYYAHLNDDVECAKAMLQFREHLKEHTKVPVFELIYRMTDPDPLKRITSEEALKIAGELDVDNLYDNA